MNALNPAPTIPERGGSASADAHAARRTGYRPELDALRAVAILGVLLNHVDSKLLPWGFVGVEVFLPSRDF